MSIPKINTIATILNNDGSTAFQIQSEQYPTKPLAEAGLAVLSASLLELGQIANLALAGGWNVSVEGQKLSSFIAEALDRLKAITSAVGEFYQELSAIVGVTETTLEEVDLNRLRKLLASMKPFAGIQAN